MAKKVLIIGQPSEGRSDLILQAMKEQYGDDVVLYTPDEAKEQGLTMGDFENIPTMKITAPPIIPLVEIGEYKSGKENRRERRKKERNYKK